MRLRTVTHYAGPPLLIGFVLGFVGALLAPHPPAEVKPATATRMRPPPGDGLGTLASTAYAAPDGVLQIC